MCSALLIAAIGIGVMAQTGHGVVTSTDLMAPDVSASERSSEPPLPRQEVPAAPAERQPSASTEQRPHEERPSQPSTEERPSQVQPTAVPRQVTSEEAQHHKAVAAFWFILPES